jgi:hypothetical protein
LKWSFAGMLRSCRAAHHERGPRGEIGVASLSRVRCGSRLRTRSPMKRSPKLRLATPETVTGRVQRQAMNFFRESRRGLTSRTGLCSSRRQRMGAIPSETGIAELLKAHGLSGILRTSRAISEARPVMRLAEIAEHGRGFKIRGYTQDHISLTGIAPRLAPHQIQPTSAGLRTSLVGTSAASPAWRVPRLMGPPSVRTAYEPA